MKTRPDIYLPNGYLRPGIIATPGTPSEVLPQVLQYFAPPGARLPHKFRQTFRNNRLFKLWESGKLYVDEYDNDEILQFLAGVQTWALNTGQQMHFFFLDDWNTQLNGVNIRFNQDWYFQSFADGQHQVFEAMPARKPHGIWSLETDEEIQLWKSRKHLFTIKK